MAKSSFKDKAGARNRPCGKRNFKEIWPRPFSFLVSYLKLMLSVYMGFHAFAQSGREAQKREVLTKERKMTSKRISGGRFDFVDNPDEEERELLDKKLGKHAKIGGKIGTEPDERKTGDSFSVPRLDSTEGLGKKIKQHIKKMDKKQFFLLLMVFVLAFGARGHLIKYQYMFGFDPYYHARMAGFLIENGYVPQVDPMAYYSIPGGQGPPLNQFFWYFTAAIYKIGSIPFTGGAYDKDLWIMFVKVLPALFGALISVAMYFLGKEMYGRKVGYTTAIMAAIVPGFVYRTLAGTFEEDCLGFLWLIIGFVFFARAVKDPVFNKRGIINAVLSGISFGIMALTWEMFLLIPMVLGLYFVFALMNIYTKMGLRKLLDFVKLYVISLAIFVGTATFNYGLSWYNKAVGYATNSVSIAGTSLGLPEGAGFGLVLGLFVVFAAFIAFIAYSNRQPEKKESGDKTIRLISTIILYCAVIALVITFLTIPILFEETSVLGRSVGEENTGYQFFGSKYNALIVFPGLALLLIPIRLYRDRKDHLSAMIFFWVMITYFMAWYKLKFTYTFGLPIAAASGLVAAEIFFYVKDRPGIERKVVSLALGFMILTGVAATTIFVADNVPNIELGYPNWKDALHWMRDPNNIPADAKMFNWWDEGHWISFIGERIVSSDNRNASFESNRDFALFAITADLNEALGIAKTYNFDYVILSSDMFLKIGSFGNYAYNTINSGDPRIVKFLIAPHAAIECGKDGPDIECGNNRFSAEKMNTIPTDWTTQSNQMYTMENGYTVPLYVYRDRNNEELYIVNPAVNESILGRLWLHESEAMQYFEEVYSKQGIKIFKAKKDAIALAQ